MVKPDAWTVSILATLACLLGSMFCYELGAVLMAKALLAPMFLGLLAAFTLVVPR